MGKTNVLTRYAHNQFKPAFQTTVGIEFSSKVVYVEEKPLQINMWDTAGQEKYQCMAPMFYK